MTAVLAVSDDRAVQVIGNGREPTRPVAQKVYLYIVADARHVARVLGLNRDLVMSKKCRDGSYRSGLKVHQHLYDCSVTAGLHWQRLPVRPGPAARRGPGAHHLQFLGDQETRRH
jgi:hypothetical protein